MKMKYAPGSQSTIVCENRSFFGALFGLVFAGIGIFLMLPESWGGKDNFLGLVFLLLGLLGVFLGFETNRLVIDIAKRTLSIERSRWGWRYRAEDYPLDGMSIRVAASYGDESTTYRIEFFRDDKVIPVTSSYDNINVKGKYADAQAIADACNIPYVQ